jgi:acyl dehydratase
VSGPDRTYFEDLIPGESAETQGITITRTHVAQFLGLTAELPGADLEAAVPDLLPICLSSGLGWRVAKPRLAILAFIGCEWRFLQPLHVGDTIHSRAVTLTTRPMREAGLMVEARDIVTHRGEVAQSGKLSLLVAKRPPPAR